MRGKVRFEDMKLNKLLYKVIVWRLVSVAAMLLTMWAITGNLVASTGVTLVVQLVQTLVHGVFEALWDRKS